MNCPEEVVLRGSPLDAIRRIGLSWPMLLGAMAFLAVLASGEVRIGPDTYWHIVAGHWILVNGHVPTHDPFSFTVGGAHWIAQSWGAELLIASLYGVAGWAGLVLLAAALFGLTIAYLARFLLSRMEPLHAVLLTVLSGCMMISYILVRPEEFVWPLMAVWVGELIEASESAGVPPWWLLSVMVLWANLHGSFLLGLSLAVLIAAEAIINARKNRKEVARRWTVFVAAAFGCALINPQGWRLMVFPFHVLGMPVLRLLAEWRQANFQHLHVFGFWLAAMLALAFAGRIRLPLLRLAPFVALIYFALLHIRIVPLLGLVSPFLIASPLANLWRVSPVGRSDAGILVRSFQALAGPGRRTALVAAIVISGALGVALVSMRRPSQPKRYTPRAALDALLSRQPDARILNDYSFGGYLMFRGIPVFVDGRFDMYGNRFLVSYFEALELVKKGKFGALMRKYKINAILMRPEQPVVRLLNRLPDWKRVYAGRVAVAYVRRGSKS